MKMRKSPMDRVLPCLLVVLIVSIAGCGGSEFDTAPVSGKVMHDGKPVTGGSLTFRPVNPTPGGETANLGKPATAAVQSDGTYVLGTYKKNDGAVPGQHKVSYSAPVVEVQWVEKDGDMKPASDVASPYDGLRPKVAQVEVKDGRNQIDIELVSKK